MINTKKSFYNNIKLKNNTLSTTTFYLIQIKKLLSLLINSLQKQINLSAIFIIHSFCKKKNISSTKKVVNFVVEIAVKYC